MYKMMNMKIKNLNFKTGLVLLFTAFMALWACKEEEMNYPRTRLFQPVLNEDLYAVNNTIVVNLGRMKEAVKYKIEVSRDSFLTVDYAFETDTNYFVIDKNIIGEDLLWFTVYQVRATAYADQEQYNSLPSLLGSVRTQKFPSNMGTPTPFDVLDTRARVFWTPIGAPITKIKVFAATDLRLTNPLSEIDVTQDDRDAKQKIIGGLEPNTAYQIAIYSDETLRGWEQYTTKEALVSGPNVYDLTGIDTVVNLAAVLPDMVDEAIVMLEGGKKYLAGGYAFDKSVAFISGYSFTPALPVIECSSNFNLADGSNVGYVTFRNIELTSPGLDGFNGRYVFNTNVSATIGEIKFESCRIHNLRGVVRTKDAGPGVLDKYTITNCQIDSIRDYGILTIDRDDWQVNHILIENSTLSKVRTFITSRNNTVSFVIDGCTLSEVTSTGQRMFRWRTAGQDNVTEGITIKNTIVGHAWDEENKGDYGIDAFDGLAGTTWLITNSYATSQFAIADGKDAIPGFPSFVYPGTDNDLWVDPANGNFNIKDSGFAGKSDAGDPRWRVGL